MAGIKFGWPAGSGIRSKPRNGQRTIFGTPIGTKTKKSGMQNSAGPTGSGPKFTRFPINNTG